MEASTTDNVYGLEREAIDSEHRIQIGLVIALRKTLEAGGPKATVADILDRLISYTDAHFMAEQLLMRQYAYPLYEAHVQEHDRLIEQVHELQKNYQVGQMQMTLEVAMSLEGWLLGHIKQTDHALGQYLSEHAGASRASRGQPLKRVG